MFNKFSLFSWNAQYSFIFHFAASSHFYVDFFTFNFPNFVVFINNKNICHWARASVDPEQVSSPSLDTEGNVTK